MSEMQIVEVDSPRVKQKRNAIRGHSPVVYILGADGDGPVKIGTSSDLARRALSLQTGNPLPLLVLGFRLVMPKHLPPGRDCDTVRHLVEGSAKLENKAHLELHNMGLRLMGEWFDVTAEESAAVLDKAAPLVGCRTFSTAWLLSEGARLDPEYGWMHGELLAKALTVGAQIEAVNELTLTAAKCSGIL